MDGVGLLIVLAGIATLGALIVWSKRRQRERDLATASSTHLATLIPPPVEDPGLVAARTELAEQDAWLGQETARAAAWAQWVLERDQLIAALKLNPPPILYKIERGLDNIYRAKRWVLTTTPTPNHIFNHGDVDAVAGRDEGRGYSSGLSKHSHRMLGGTSRDPARYIAQKPKLPWPEKIAPYTESWERMNKLEFGFLQESEQWLDDFLNPKGRSWGYGALGDKISDMGEPEPVESIESHFREGYNNCDGWVIKND